MGASCDLGHMHQQASLGGVRTCISYVYRGNHSISEKLCFDLLGSGSVRKSDVSWKSSLICLYISLRLVQQMPA